MQQVNTKLANYVKFTTRKETDIKLNSNESNYI